LHKLGLPTPVIPDVDGLHHDWTLFGKKIQAKVAWKRKKKMGFFWQVNHQHVTHDAHQPEQQAVSYGEYQALWVHLGVDQFMLLPASILRRHQTFLGQWTSAKGRSTLRFYPNDSPSRAATSKWKQLCEPYVCSWSEAGLKAKVEKILANC